MTDTPSRPSLVGPRTLLAVAVLAVPALLWFLLRDTSPAWMKEARAEVAAACERLAADPHDADARRQRALARENLGDYDAALEDWDGLLAADPEHSADHRGRAWTLYLAERDTEAFRAIDRAVALDDQDPENHVILGKMLLCQAQYPQALEAGRRALALDEEGAGSSVVGQALARLGRDDEALAQLDRAVRVEPWNCFVHTARGEVLFRGGRIHESLDAFDRALEIDPECSEALMGWEMANAASLTAQVFQGATSFLEANR